MSEEIKDENVETSEQKKQKGLEILRTIKDSAGNVSGG